MMPDMTSVPNETLTLKAMAAEARRPEPATPVQLATKTTRHTVSDDQLEAIKAHKAGIEQPLMWAAIGICLGSATGSLSALNVFLKGGVLTIDGFVQNICFFSSLMAALILAVIHLPRRKDFHRLVDAIRHRDG